MNILSEIAGRTTERVAAAKKIRDFPGVRRDAESLPSGRAEKFASALKSGEPSFICEIKQASPSQGDIIAPEKFSPLKIAGFYAAAGAEALSILTEPFYFHGRDEYIPQVAAEFTLPILRKDFTVDLYQIYEAKNLGAAAILLIVALLDLPRLRDYLAAAREIGIAALVETHCEKELETALAAEAQIIGINNRDLQSFTVDLATTNRLMRIMPADRLVVAESGIKNRADIETLSAARVKAVLIGEILMRAADPSQKIRELRGKNR